MQVNISPRFKRSYKKLPERIKKDFDTKVAIFMSNPRDIKLKTHKLNGKLQNCLSFYLCEGYRVLFEFVLSDQVNFLDIVSHDKYKQW